MGGRQVLAGTFGESVLFSCRRSARVARWLARCGTTWTDSLPIELHAPLFVSPLARRGRTSRFRSTSRLVFARGMKAPISTSTIRLALDEHLYLMQGRPGIWCLEPFQDYEDGVLALANGWAVDDQPLLAANVGDLVS